MKFSININEMEQQRYNAIKRKGEYVELDILIGVDDSEFRGHTGKMPVVTTQIHGAGPTEIACMYATLNALVKQWEEDYPAECLYAKMCMNSQNVGTVQTEIKRDKKED